MRMQTILNACQKLKSFVYQEVKWCDEGSMKSLEVRVLPRKNSKPICSICHKVGSCYDHQQERRFEFVPLLGFPVYFRYQMRRVNCKRCGIKVELLPWADGKQTMTKARMQHLASWAKKLSWLETARSFNTTWQKVFASVKYVVQWGLKHRDLSGIESIGVDEIAWKKGHKYLTLVYQIDKHRTRLLWIGKDRTIKTMLRFFRFLGPARSKKLKHICSDMWKPYLKVIRKKATNHLKG